VNPRTFLWAAVGTVALAVFVVGAFVLLRALFEAAL
jgi:hypothetical protein